MKLNYYLKLKFFKSSFHFFYNTKPKTSAIKNVKMIKERKKKCLNYYSLFILILKLLLFAKIHI